MGVIGVGLVRVVPQVVGRRPFAHKCRIVYDTIRSILAYHQTIIDIIADFSYRCPGGFNFGAFREVDVYGNHVPVTVREEDKRQSTYTAQSDYKLSPKTYLYGSFKGVDSRYSAYFKDYTLSGGLGYQFFNTDVFVLELELGPGFRYQEPNTDEIGDSDIVFEETVQEAIFRGKVNSSWQILKNLSLAADMTLVAGDSNLRVDTDINVTNNITEDIALKLAHTRQYHDRVPEGLKKADSIFSVNLLFLF